MQMQQNMLVPHPSDLPAEHDQDQDGGFSPFNLNADPEYPAPQQPPAPPPNQSPLQHVSTGFSTNTAAADPNALSLLTNDDVATYEPLLDNTADLQKTYRDAADITAEVDAMQASLDSLIQNLGLDPNVISNFQTNNNANMDRLQLQPEMEPVLSHSDTSAPLSAPATHAEQGGQEQSGQFSMPDFDLEAFLTELNRRSGDEPDTLAAGDAADYPGATPSTVTPSVGTGSAESPGHLSAFVDEVTSQSDVTSPVITRAFLDEQQHIVEPQVNTIGKKQQGRKRKSTTSEEPATGGRNGIKSKRKK